MRKAAIYVVEQLAGWLIEDEYGYHFSYDKEYIARLDARPASLTLPVRDRPYTSLDSPYRLYCPTRRPIGNPWPKGAYIVFEELGSLLSESRGKYTVDRGKCISPIYFLNIKGEYLIFHFNRDAENCNRVGLALKI